MWYTTTFSALPLTNIIDAWLKIIRSEKKYVFKIQVDYVNYEIDITYFSNIILKARMYSLNYFDFLDFP